MGMIRRPTSMKAFRLLLIFIQFAELNAESLVTEEIFKRISSGNDNAVGLVDSPEREAVRRRALDGLSDKEIIRGVVEVMFRHPNKDHAMIPSLAFNVLISPRREVKDVSELRRLMNAEPDSQRFYMLSRFAMFFQSRYQESFMVERSRGLTMTGPAALSGQGETNYRLSDISLFTYDSLVRDLKEMDSPFVKDIIPTLTDKPAGAKVVELARWMKANWPGCEGLSIPDKGDDRPLQKPHGNLAGSSQEPIQSPPTRTKLTQDAPEREIPFLAIMISTGLVVLASSFYFLRRNAR